VLAGGRPGHLCLPPGQLTGVAERLLPAERGHDPDQAQVELFLPPGRGGDPAVFERVTVGPESFFVKRLSASSDWIMRIAGDHVHRP